MYTILLVVHTILVVFLILMVLLQRTDSDGLGGLSGGGGNQFLTGRSQANLMTRTTAILAAAFMITSLVLAAMAGRMNNGSIIDAVPIEQTTPAPAPVSAPKDQVPDAAPAVPTEEMKKEAPAEKSAEKPAKKKAAPAVPKPE